MSVVWAPRDAVREYPPMFVVDHPPCLGANPPCLGEDPGVHHDGAIHVTPTLGVPAPSPAGFLRTRPNQTSRTSASFDQQFPARAPRCSHPRDAHHGSAGALAGRVSQGVTA